MYYDALGKLVRRFPGYEEVGLALQKLVFFPWYGPKGFQTSKVIGAGHGNLYAAISNGGTISGFL